MKTDDGGLRDKDYSYTWYDPDTPGGVFGTQNGGSCSGASCDTTGYAAAVNTQGLCGANGWRVPSKDELKGLVYCSNGTTTPLPDYTNCGIDYISPTIAAEYFPNAAASDYWSSSAYASLPSYAWFVDFYYGTDTTYLKSNNRYLRLVRGGHSLNVTVNGVNDSWSDGRVDSSPVGIDCDISNGVDCQHYYPQGIQVTLTLRRPTGNLFVGWLGAVQERVVVNLLWILIRR